MAVPAAVYSLLMYGTGFMAILYADGLAITETLGLMSYWVGSAAIANISPSNAELLKISGRKKILK